MPVAPNCPNCGAGLPIESLQESVVKCPYCKRSVVVPHAPPAPSPVTPIPRVVPRPAGLGFRITRFLGNSLNPIVGIAVSVLIAMCFLGYELLGDKLGDKLTSYAELLMEFGEQGMGPGQFNDPRGIAVDGAGNIYVADYQGGRVQMLDPKGKFLAQWMVGDPDAIIKGFTGDRDGDLYVVTTKSFDKRKGRTGEVIQTYGRGYSNVALSQEGWLVANVYAGDDFVLMDRNGTVTLTVKDSVKSVTGLNRGYSFEGFAVDGVGNIYAVQDYECAVFKFSREGRYVNRYFGKGDSPEKLVSPHAIVVDGQGRMYVSDLGGVKVFDRDGVYLGIIKTQNYVFAMTLADDGYLFTVSGNKVQKWKLPR